MLRKGKIGVTRYVDQINIRGQSFSDVVKGIDFRFKSGSGCKSLSSDSYDFEPLCMIAQARGVKKFFG
jgi:hypothetical protein